MTKIYTALRIYRDEGFGGIGRIFKIKFRPFTRRVRHVYLNIKDGFSAIFPEQDRQQRARDAGEYWSESAASERIRDLSHWQNEGRWVKDKTWAGIGEKHFAKWELLRNAFGAKNVNERMVEWGPGGGSNMVRFAKEFDTLYGVDISEANLGECARQIALQGRGEFEQVLIPADEPARCLNNIQGECDFFLSTAVFQYFPSKEYGVEVLHLVKKLLRQGGGALIQIRYDDLSRRFMPKSRDYKRNAITFTSYPLHEFWNLLIAAGLKPCCVQLEPDVNYAYFFIVNEA